MEIVAELLRRGVKVTAYDPKAMETAKALIGDKISYAGDAYQAAENADVLAVLTEWDDFRSLDLKRLKSVMKTPSIVDLRNLLNPDEALANGFEYRGIGR